MEKIGERNLEQDVLDWRKSEKEICEFFLNKEKEKVMKTKEKLCQKRLFRNLLGHPEKVRKLDNGNILGG